MASAYSQPTEYIQYQPQFNKELLNQVMGVKQQTYDFNRERIQQTLNRVVGLDVMKGEDQDYLYGRIQAIADEVNRYGMGDLSSNSRADYLNSYISQIADDKVHNAYAGTLAVRNIYAEAEAAKEDGTYNEDNLAFSLQAAQSWLADGQVGSEYKGNSDYTPYTDLDALFMDKIKEIEPSAYLYKTPAGDYTFYTESGERISPERVRAAINSTIMSNPNAAKQVEVNAWAQYGQATDQEMMGIYDEYVAPSLGIMEAQQAELKEAIIKAETPEQEEVLKQQLSFVEQQYQQLKERPNPTAVREYLYKEQLLDGYVEAYSYESLKSIDFVTNEEALSIEEDKRKAQSDLASEARKALAAIEEAEAIKDFSLARGLEQTYKPILDQYYASMGQNWDYQNKRKRELEPQMREGKLDTSTSPFRMLDEAESNIQSKTIASLSTFKELADSRYTEKELLSYGYKKKDGNGGVVWNDAKIKQDIYGTKLNTILDDYVLEKLGKAPLTNEEKRSFANASEELSFAIDLDANINSIQKEFKENYLSEFDNMLAVARNTNPSDRRDDWGVYGNKVTIDLTEGTTAGEILFGGLLNPLRAVAQLGATYQDPDKMGYSLGESTKANIIYKPDGLLYFELTNAAGTVLSSTQVTETEAKDILAEYTSKGFSSKVVANYKKIGEYNEAVNDEYLGTLLTQKLGDVVITPQIVVSSDVTSTMELFKDVVTTAETIGSDGGLGVFSDLNRYVQAVDNFSAGSGTEASAGKPKITENPIIYYNVLTDEVILEMGGNKPLVVPRNKLGQQTLAYSVFTEQKQVAEGKLSAEFRDDKYFRTIKPDSKIGVNMSPEFFTLVFEDGTTGSYSVQPELIYSKYNGQEFVTFRNTIYEYDENGQPVKSYVDPQQGKYSNSYDALINASQNQINMADLSDMDEQSRQYVFYNYLQRVLNAN